MPHMPMVESPWRSLLSGFPRVPRSTIMTGTSPEVFPTFEFYFKCKFWRPFFRSAFCIPLKWSQNVVLSFTFKKWWMLPDCRDQRQDNPSSTFPVDAPFPAWLPSQNTKWTEPRTLMEPLPIQFSPGVAANGASPRVQVTQEDVPRGDWADELTAWLHQTLTSLIHKHCADALRATCTCWIPPPLDQFVIELKMIGI